MRTDGLLLCLWQADFWTHLPLNGLKNERVVSNVSIKWVGEKSLVEQATFQVAPLSAAAPDTARIQRQRVSASGGKTETITSVVADLTGKPPPTFSEFARDHAASFQPPQA